MSTSYGHYREFPGWDAAADFFGAMIDHERCGSVLEIGAGANPTLPPARAGATYTTNDVSATELEKAGPGYETLCLDIAAATRADLPLEAFDFVFSRMVNEHVKDGERYYRNVFDLLKPGGLTAHCFSTLYALPFAVNRVLPERITGPILDVVNPRDHYQQGKFRAYYSWSRGPSRRMIGRLRGLGYDVVEYRGFFGHPYYNGVLRPLRALEEAKAAWLCRHPIASLTSYATLVLRKPW